MAAEPLSWQIGDIATRAWRDYARVGTSLSWYHHVSSRLTYRLPRAVLLGMLGIWPFRVPGSQVVTLDERGAGISPAEKTRKK